MDILMRFLDNAVSLPEPWKTLIIAFIITVITCIAVILIGSGIAAFEQLEMRILTKLFSQKTAIFIEDRLTFLGTMLHETAHALIAWATGAQVVKMRLLTFFDAHRLGYVHFQPRGNRVQQYFQLSLISCAPVILGMIELNIIWIILENMIIPIGLRIFLIYLFISILNHMSMSKADIKNYCRGLKIVAPVMFLIFYGIRIGFYR